MDGPLIDARYQSEKVDCGQVGPFSADKSTGSGTHSAIVPAGSQGDKENHRIVTDSADKRVCFACNRSLSSSPQLINVAGKTNWWHPECFRCDLCSIPLDKEPSCHLYRDRIVCRADYARLQRDLSIKCSRCRWPVGASDWVRKAGEYVYHLACFSCDICQRQLSTGEHFKINLVEERRVVRLLCRLHFNNPPPCSTSSSLAATSTSSNTTTAGQTTNRPRKSSWRAPNSRHTSLSVQADHSPLSLAPLYESCTETTDQHRPPKVDDYGGQILATASNPIEMSPNVDQSSFADCVDQHSPISGFDSPVGQSTSGAEMAALKRLESPLGTGNSSVSTGSQSSSSNNNLLPNSGTNLLAAGSNSSSNSKSKRVRTTFTEEQLSILQEQFGIDSNPDGQDLERIAIKTGLSKRVTQVWFQNSRARQKKYLIKRKPTMVVSSHTTSPSPSRGTVGQLNVYDKAEISLQQSNANWQAIQRLTNTDSTNTSLDRPSAGMSWSNLSQGSLKRAHYDHIPQTIDEADNPDVDLSQVSPVASEDLPGESDFDDSPQVVAGEGSENCCE